MLAHQLPSKTDSGRGLGARLNLILFLKSLPNTEMVWVWKSPAPEDCEIANWVLLMTELVWSSYQWQKGHFLAEAISDSTQKKGTPRTNSCSIFKVALNLTVSLRPATVAKCLKT